MKSRERRESLKEKRKSSFISGKELTRINRNLKNKIKRVSMDATMVP